MTEPILRQIFELARQKQLAGFPAEAEALYLQILSRQPDHPGAADVHFEIGNIAAASGRFEQAVAAYRHAIQLRPDFPAALNNLANALQDQHRLPEAIDACRKAIALRPDWPELHSTMGNLLKDSGDFGQAIECYRRALQLRPEFPDALNNLANILHESGALDEAIAMFQKVLALSPNQVEAHYNLGNALRESGQIAAAIASFDRALALDSGNSIALGNRIYAMHFGPAYDTPAICAQLARWNQLHAAPLSASIQPHGNSTDPQRRLRVGYVSPDFREHVVGWNLLPLMSRHDHGNFEIFCYSSVARPDTMTEKLKAHADVWREIFGIPNAQAAQIVREDKIDVLVDLSLHSAHHRLLLFAQKPAPVQVTYLGYCGSTGLPAIDYRLSDPNLEAPEWKQHYAEETICLPSTYWCYQPGGETPDVNALPAISAGHVTFGCLNNFAKVSDSALELWARILASLPGSKLLLHAPLGNSRARVLKSIPQDRIEFVAKQDLDQYMRTYQKIDIALDPFPYNGGITTCDALWMGVPVISLEGRTAVGRAGKSILYSINLEDLVAQTPDQCLAIATRLAQDTNRLVNLRATLRDNMKSSPLMDAPAFARDVESIYRQIWRQWRHKESRPRT